MKYPVVHFEIPFKDKDKQAEYYSKAFGWEKQEMGPDMGDYVVVTTTDVDPDTNRPKEPGAINGGLFKQTDDSQKTSIVVAVDDIHKAMEQVVEAGGKILGSSKGMDEPDDIPGVGLYMSTADPEGNKIALLQTKS